MRVKSNRQREASHTTNKHAVVYAYLRINVFNVYWQFNMFLEGIKNKLSL